MDAMVFIICRINKTGSLDLLWPLCEELSNSKSYFVLCQPSANHRRNDVVPHTLHLPRYRYTLSYFKFHMKYSSLHFQQYPVSNEAFSARICMEWPHHIHSEYLKTVRHMIVVPWRLGMLHQHTLGIHLAQTHCRRHRLDMIC